MNLGITREGPKGSDIMYRFSRMMEGIPDEVLDKVADQIIVDAKANFQMAGHNDSGETLQTIEKRKNDQGEIELYFGGASLFIENGTGPKVPKKPDGVLRFVADTGEVVYTKYAGPTEASPFIAPAIMSNLETVNEMLERQAEEKAKELK